MKICILTATMDHGGASIVAFDVAKGMANRGHEVLVVCSGNTTHSAQQDGYTLHTLANPFKNPAFHYFNPILIFKLAGFLRHHKPDIIHVHNINLQTFSLATLLLSRFYPMIWTLHDIWPLCMTGWPPIPDCNGMLSKCMQCPTWPAWLSRINRTLKETVYGLSLLHVASPSEWLAGMASSSRLSRHHFQVIYNGIDTASYLSEPRETVRSRLGIPETKKVILFCGGRTIAGQSPAWRKGWAYLYEALEMLGGKYPDLHLLYIGDRLKLPAAFPMTVSFVEGARREQMKGFCNASDIFVLPTIADHPALTVLEAMAFGAPVISTRAGGIPEAVIDNETGLLCPSRNAAALAEKMEYLIQNPSIGGALAESARHRFNKLFSYDRMLDQYEAVYRLAVSCPTEPVIIPASP